MLNIKKHLRFFTVHGPNTQAERFYCGYDDFKGVARIKINGLILGVFFWTPKMIKNQKDAR